MTILDCYISLKSVKKNLVASCGYLPSSVKKDKLGFLKSRFTFKYL